MEELKFLRDNWVLVFTGVLIMSMVSLSSVYVFFDFDILEYVSFQDSITILFKLGLRFELLILLILILILWEANSYLKKKMEQFPLWPSFLFLIMTIIVFFAIKYEFRLQVWSDNTEIYLSYAFVSVVIILNLGKIGKQIFPDPIGRKFAYFACNIFFLHICLSFNYARLILRNKLHMTIIKFEQHQISTNKNLFILFQSTEILVLRNEIEKSNIIYKMDNIKSIEECY